MANLDELKKKAKEALNTIADVSVEAYKVAEEKAKVVARRAKLNAEIAREKALIRRNYSEIGKAYYELRKDDAEEAFKQNCEDITASLDSIEAKRAEIEDLKAGKVVCCDGEECDCDAETAPAPEEAPKQDSADDNSNSGW